MLYRITLVSALLLLPISSFADDAEEREKGRISGITVFGKANSDQELAGSSHVIEPEELEEAKDGFDDIHRVLRQVPGVNIQEEEGFGLRPNIGIRGVPSERSARITLMEDGVLVAPAPYTAPSAYYFPPVGRMSAIEVLKGSNQLKYGPYTTGGSINMLSTRIPTDERATLRTQFGSFDSSVTHATVGKSFKYGGFLLEGYNAFTDGFKELEGGGDTGFDLFDYLGKIRLNTDPEAEVYQELEVKLNRYDQDSDETYLGLTQEDFDRTPFRRYAGSQLDHMDVDHDGLTVTHRAELTENLSINSTYYHLDTARNWFKLDSVGGSSISSILDNPEDFAQELAWIKGADSPEDALALRNNNRLYYSRGFQTSVDTQFETGSLKHSLEWGIRYHEDEEDRFQNEENFQMVNGRLVRTSINPPGSNANRVASAEAWSTYVQDFITMGDVTVSPVLRYESIDYSRKDFGSSDPERTGADLEVVDSSVDQLIPGGSVRWQFSEPSSVFVGLHRGFSPPGAVSDPEVEEEESLNYEAGIDYRNDSFYAEAIGFLTDYDNLLGADTLSSGGLGTGALFNGGEATVWGVEATLQNDFAETFGVSSLRLPFQAAYTYTSAEFDSSFDSDFFGDVVDGDPIPYIPENQLFVSIGAEAGQFGTYLAMHFNDAMPTAGGTSGSSQPTDTDSYTVFDLGANYQIKEDLKLFIEFQNLFDEEYVVARRPAGARPGLDRTFFAGLQLELG